MDDLLAERIETVVSAVDSKGALPISPTAELSSQANFHSPALSEGFRWVGMARKRRAGRGLRAGCNIGRFGEVVIPGPIQRGRRAFYRDCIIYMVHSLKIIYSGYSVL